MGTPNARYKGRSRDSVGHADWKSKREWGYVEFERWREKTVDEIEQALAYKLPKDNAPKAFVLPRSSDIFTLRTAWTTIASAVRAHSFNYVAPKCKATEHVTVVFFSHPSAYYIYVHEIEFKDNTVQVKWQAVPHKTPAATTHLALIPLGKLPVGECRVDFDQLDLAPEFREEGFTWIGQTQRYVSISFDFKVE